MHNHLTQAIVREFFDYDPETGILTRGERDRRWFTTDRAFNSWNKRFAGRSAGHLARNGYLYTAVLGREYLAHRVIWLWMTGEWPSAGIDHENHVRTDNRWCNLRAAPQSENMKNQSMRSDNMSGVTGVRWYRAYQKWVANIRVDGKQVSLGYFSNKSDAIAARKSAEIKYGFHPNHGRIAA